MRTDIYNQIINMLPSSSLRAKIVEVGYIVPEIDLLRIVYHHAASFADQIKYFNILQEEGASDDVRMNAKLIREHLEKNFADFEGSVVNAVYELRIKDSPESYEEKYLCATLEDALRAIPLFYELYSSFSEETGQSRYCIEKRKIFDSSKPFAEDHLSECEYRAGGLLYRIYGNESIDCDDEDEDMTCEKCDKACIAKVHICPSLPKHIADGDIVVFTDHDGKTLFGYNIDLDLYNSEEHPHDVSVTSEYYIIPLYEDGGEYDNWDLFGMHRHITAGLIERANTSDLSEKQKEEVVMMERFIRENMKKDT